MGNGGSFASNLCEWFKMKSLKEILRRKERVRVKVVYSVGDIKTVKLPLAENFKVNADSILKDWIINFKPSSLFEERWVFGRRKILIVAYSKLNAIGWNDNSSDLDNFMMYYTKKEAEEILKKLNEKAKSSANPFKTTWLVILLGASVINILIVLYFAEKMGLLR